MTRSILCGIAVAMLFCGNALADDVRRGRLDLHPTKLDNILPRVVAELQHDAGPRVIGKKGRKYIRYTALPENLKADKAAVREEFGFTPHRLRVRGGGRSFERWKYYGKGLEFVFDGKGKLVEIATFPPQVNHMD